MTVPLCDLLRLWLYPYWRWTPRLKRSLVYAPLWRKRRATPTLFGVLPTRLHALFISSYFILNVAYMLLLDWSSSEKNIYSQVRKRSGTIAAANIIPLFVLVARNNLLVRLLGISSDTCNFVHRWVGRVVILESVVHVGAWLRPKIAHEGWPVVAAKFRDSPFIITGLVGSIALVLILIQSLKPLRTAAYELFRHIHLFFALLFAAATIAHCTVSPRPPQRAFVVTGVIILGTERCMRLFWRYYRNICGRKSTSAVVEVMLGEPRACRVVMELPRHVDIGPGMHAYLSFKEVGPHESHPFSIAWWEDAEPLNDGDVRSTKVTFIISAHNGFSKKLYDHATNQTGRFFRTGATFEGPYGSHRSLDSYGHVVLFAGGTGITHQIAYVRQFLRGYAINKTATSRMVLIWAVREADLVEWVRSWLRTINGMRVQYPNILVLRLFITGSTSSSTHAEDGIEMEAFAGRPPIGSIMETETLQQIGAMCVSVCGPGGMADDVRAAVRLAQYSKQAIDFVEESFGW
ncbi:ferric reductase like transmembrane component-domain-containing protein [Coniochaeta sp. 2T2.1]|nr:ferric reductase like transmembrane component-domain-containing protein [Coniochaeta sp. 2T2.1]